MGGVLTPNTKSKLFKNNNECPVTFGKILLKLYNEMKEGNSQDIARLDELPTLIDPSTQTNEAEGNDEGDPIPTLLRVIPLKDKR